MPNWDDATRENRSADEYYEQMLSMKQDFRFGNRTLLENPWNGFGDINWLWVIPLFSWLTALGSSLISLRYTKLATGNGEKQPGQGCSTFTMVFAMPLFSLLVTFYGAWRSRYLLDLLQPDRHCPDDCAQHHLQSCEDPCSGGSGIRGAPPQEGGG